MSFPRYSGYKASGLPWVAHVPEHWVVPAVGYRYEVLLGKMLDEKKITGKHLAPYLRNIDVQWDRIDTENLPQMQQSGAASLTSAITRRRFTGCARGTLGETTLGFFFTCSK